jgi:large subunit ribosomal protein L13
MKTRVTKLSDIKRQWHLIDVNGQILGRIATQIAQKLIGKDKVYFASNIDCGDYIVVINASKIQVSGKKSKQKIYYRHSGFPGGFKELSFDQQLKKDPTQIIIRAVKNMLPKNKLQSPRLKRLKIFTDEKHIYEDKFKNINEDLKK